MRKSARDFFSPQEEEEIRQAVMSAELDTSGEIRVHIENTCSGDVMDRAAYIFKKLGMNKTAQRNGVLIYLAVKNRRFAILGDQGIHAVVPENFWDGIKTDMLSKFREDHFVEGLIHAIESTGKHLKKHFPRQKDDNNELSDDISFG
ncbi:MAG TPA: TPM domain-containing protein [Bacteroidales bacterium]|nr:TPM domain-containing protein [Bacteroidales bacterium]HPT09405.1 TPM domain-containing protein [Bacteroidales bacterium]